MANQYLDTALVDKAIRFAVEAHAGTERRGKGFPYVIHVLEAMEITATLTSDPEILAAAALHDTVEDTDVNIELIRSEFGDRIADMVDAESDRFETGVSETDSWRSRKQAAIDRIKKASPEAKMVAMGDKLSNMRAIFRDYCTKGDKLWDLFHAPGGRKDHEWHYRGLAEALLDLSGTFPYEEFCELIEKVFGGPEAELIDMNDYVESGDGFTAISYNHKGGNRMIKLYGEMVPSSEAKREYGVSKALERLGFNIPRALRLVTDGKRVGLEFERIANKRSFARAISQEPENMEKYMREFARMCKQMHSTPCDTSTFKPAEIRFLKGIHDNKFYSEAEKEKMIAFIHSVPRATTCVHGDLHIGNALLADGKEYWIDLSDFGYGNPLFDLGMFYFLIYGVNNDAMISWMFHFPLAQLKVGWAYFIDEYFGSGCSLEEANRRIAPFAALYMVHFENRRPIEPGMREFIKEKLLAI